MYFSIDLFDNYLYPPPLNVKYDGIVGQQTDDLLSALHLKCRLEQLLYGLATLSFILRLGDTNRISDVQHDMPLL